MTIRGYVTLLEHHIRHSNPHNELDSSTKISDKFNSKNNRSGYRA